MVNRDVHHSILADFIMKSLSKINGQGSLDGNLNGHRDPNSSEDRLSSKISRAEKNLVIKVLKYDSPKFITAPEVLRHGGLSRSNSALQLTAIFKCRSNGPRI